MAGDTAPHWHGGENDPVQRLVLQERAQSRRGAPPREGGRPRREVGQQPPKMGGRQAKGTRGGWGTDRLPQNAPIFPVKERKGDLLVRGWREALKSGEGA